MRIITISRQFGSGGRELGKRLADRLNWDYYDREIIEALAEEHGLDEAYVRQMLSSHGWHNLQLTYRNSFSHLSFVDPGIRTQLLVRTREILQEIAEAGNDCIIVGRDDEVDVVRIRVRIHDTEHGDTQTVGLADGNLLLQYINHEQGARQTGQVGDGTEVLLQLGALTGNLQQLAL